MQVWLVDKRLIIKEWDQSCSTSHVLAPTKALRTANFEPTEHVNSIPTPERKRPLVWYLSVGMIIPAYSGKHGNIIKYALYIWNNLKHYKGFSLCFSCQSMGGLLPRSKWAWSHWQVSGNGTCILYLPGFAKEAYNIYIYYISENISYPIHWIALQTKVMGQTNEETLIRETNKFWWYTNYWRSWWPCDMPMTSCSTRW